MADTEEKTEEAEAPAKSNTMKTLLLSVVSALALGGVAAGVALLIPAGDPSCDTDAGGKSAKHGEQKAYTKLSIVKMEPLVVSLGPQSDLQYLKISIALEIPAGKEKDVEHLQPKFRDVLNMYLRAVDERVLTDPSAMARLRAQILRRMQLVAPPGVVQNVLITDFVLT